ncbi:membrane protein [Streptomyces albus]|uniref:LolA family protein n=1 Tax=Streptomyces albus TaxID=1888 RepID=UPI0004C8D94F|nr:membrane protein [Streptomyces albus]
MPGKRPTQTTDTWDGEGTPSSPARGLARWGVPVAVAGVAVAGIGLVPAIASSGSPDLPKITAAELIERMAESDTERLSGTVKVNTDLGLPALPGMGGGSGGFGGLGAGHGGDGPDGDRGVAGPGSGGDEQGSPADPQAKLMELASGSHTLRVAADGPDKQRLSIMDKAAEYSVIHNGEDLWAYDSGSNSAYHAALPEHDAGEHAEHHKNGKKGQDGKHGLPEGMADATPRQLAEHALKAVDETTTVKVDGTAKIAGRDAYQLVIMPKAPESTVEAVRISVDAENGVPLKFTLTPRSGGKAAIDVGFTSVDFGKPAAETFEFKPPKGTKVTEEDLSERAGKHAGHRENGDAGERGRHGAPKAGEIGSAGLNVIGEGWTSVAQLQAPAGKRGPGGEELPAEAEQLLDSFGERVRGDFGTGRVFSTRLVNVLMTDDGGVYAGAVDKAALVKAAEKAEKAE